ncbi:MAG: hypothetical protein JXA75_01190 [Candidatus Thermoplasmatota archaeon]|nr:hypothetical protein [Candidatus Thermoplasmatota archaeon]
MSSCAKNIVESMDRSEQDVQGWGTERLGFSQFFSLGGWGLWVDRVERDG